ncbi:large ribosomal subunit protein mL62-like [Macrobrachium nipponense]|uniref:large ribosomal subunit protein mL62-like n=1 Tax=Macrobrachium nipponense TaxID=159736 RepID=UPI0030C874E6
MHSATRLCGRIKQLVNVRQIHTTLHVRQFQSAISLKTLYPKSDLDLLKKTEPPKSSGLTFSGYIPIEKVQISYSRSSGPGGQNVNKVNTKVDLRFELNTAEWLPDQLKERVREKFKTSVNSEGFLVVRSDKTRSQQLNLADALDKLRTMIHSASYEPPPHAAEDVERHRRRHEAAVRERLRQKKHRSLIKQDRQAPEVDM